MTAQKLNFKGYTTILQIVAAILVSVNPFIRPKAWSDRFSVGLILPVTSIRSFIKYSGEASLIVAIVILLNKALTMLVLHTTTF